MYCIFYLHGRPVKIHLQLQEEKHLIDDRESDVGCGRECSGEVLHHAFQPSGALELGLAAVLVLGVDKFGNQTLRFLQCFRVGLHFEDELIDVPCRQDAAVTRIQAASSMQTPSQNHSEEPPDEMPSTESNARARDLWAKWTRDLGVQQRLHTHLHLQSSHGQDKQM